jgi:hypothetical protein
VQGASCKAQGQITDGKAAAAPTKQKEKTKNNNEHKAKGEKYAVIHGDLVSKDVLRLPV